MKLEKNVILYVGFSRILSDNKIEHVPAGVVSNNTWLFNSTALIAFHANKIWKIMLPDVPLYRPLEDFCRWV